MPGLWSYCSLGVKKVIKRLHNSCRLYVLFLFCFSGIRGTFRAKSESLGGARRCCCFSHGQLKPCARNPSETAFSARKTQVNEEISNELCRPCYSFHGFFIEVARILQYAPQNLTRATCGLKS